jgi:hypothetical protein
MKHEIIYTDGYALIVSDEHIKEGDCYLSSSGIWFYNHLNPNHIKESKKIIAHRPLTDAPILEGVPILPEFSQEEDVNELAEKEYYEQTKSLEDSLVDPIFDTSRFLVTGFKDGYNKAKETYKYTEDDLIRAIELSKVQDLKVTGFGVATDFKNTKEYIVQSLQQVKRPKYFETVCDCQECGANKTNLSLDMGCENKIATITNSQGQVELVGEYNK